MLDYGPMMTRADFLDDALLVAPHLLGSVLRVTSAAGAVAVRVSEVEAYHGLGTGDIADACSHARMGYTPRNSTMWGEPGHLYIYLNYGIHSAVNVACSPEGRASGVLLRAGEVVEGLVLARSRRVASRADDDLARGPGKLAQTLGLVSQLHDSVDALSGQRGMGSEEVLVELFSGSSVDVGQIARGPRVGVAGDGDAVALPWRLWISGDPTVSKFRPGRTRNR